jgi:hypothetical protein
MSTKIGDFGSLAGLVGECASLEAPFSEIGFVFSEPACEALGLGGWTSARYHLVASSELAFKGGKARVAVGFRTDRTLLIERVVVVSDAELSRKNKIFFWEWERGGEWRMRKSGASKAATPEWFLYLSVKLGYTFRDHRNDIGCRSYCVPAIVDALRLAAGEIAKYR